MAEATDNRLANPVLVEVCRGGRVESIHRGSVIVTSLAGGEIASWGDVEAEVFPRSAIKPFQAIPLLETDACDRYHVTDPEIALATASHGGTAVHVAGVRNWLARIGLSGHDLGCGPHWPADADSARALARDRKTPEPVHNNCSGKHTGFLTLALTEGHAIETYLDPTAPVQARVLGTVAGMCGLDSVELFHAFDGCGAPAPSLPLRALAHGFARLATPDDLPEDRRRACRRIVAAMMRHPELVAGEGRFDTIAMRQFGGSVVVKSGVEGVNAAAVCGQGLGLAVKIDDGATRAADTVMAALLRRFAPVDGKRIDILAGFATPPVLNTLGNLVGEMRPAAGWMDDLRGN